MIEKGQLTHLLVLHLITCLGIIFFFPHSSESMSNAFIQGVRSSDDPSLLKMAVSNYGTAEHRAG